MQHIYLNTASCGLLPAEYSETANKLYAEMATQASVSAEHWREETQKSIRQTIAEFLGAEASNIALVPNFSWATTGVVQSLRGDEKVMLYSGDYPSLTEPFKINGFDIAWIDDTDGFTIPMQELQSKLLSEKIEVLAISHVQWLSGFKIDLQVLGSFCRQHDIWLIVDATQSLGAIPLNPVAMDIDVLISSNYKWMNAGFGTGIMYMSTEFFDWYIPKVGGNNSYTLVGGKMQYVPSVQSYEPGHPNMYGFSILQAAMQHRQAMGVAKVAQHNQQLTQQLLDGIQGLNVSLIGEATTANRASMIFLHDEDGTLLEFIKSKGIIISGRMGHVRISMHHYNTAEEVAALIEVLKQL